MCTVFVALAAELRLLANCGKTGGLSPAQFRAMAAASEEAGRVCAARGCYNSVGVTPRSIFESHKVPRAHLCEALRVVKANPPACAGALSRAWTEYLFYSLHDRYSPHELYSTDGTEAGFKAGDSGNENVWRDGQFDPATRRRYGGRFHDLIVRHGGEAYFEGNGPRMWRVLAEFIVDWLACEVLSEPSLKFKPNKATGEEGFLGLAANAETALQTVKDKVLAEEVAGEALFKDIFVACGAGGCAPTRSGSARCHRLQRALACLFVPLKIVLRSHLVGVPVCVCVSEYS